MVELRDKELMLWGSLEMFVPHQNSFLHKNTAIELALNWGQHSSL
jgi:hypothetical protein